MKAVILAAGCGKRLAATGWDKPKCLLEFGGRTLLNNIILSLLENGVEQLVLVVGYRRELLIEAVENSRAHFDIVANDEYAETNTINSLYLAREHLSEGFIYFNADVLFDRRIVSALLGCDGSAFAIDEKACGQEEVKVIVNEGRRIVRIGKKLPTEKCLGEFIGIGTFVRRDCAAMIESLRRYNEDLDEKNLFFESAVDDILADHFITAMPIGAMQAIEIDSPADYTQAQKLWDEGRCVKE